MSSLALTIILNDGKLGKEEKWRSYWTSRQRSELPLPTIRAVKTHVTAASLLSPGSVKDVLAHWRDVALVKLSKGQLLCQCLSLLLQMQQLKVALKLSNGG